MFFFSFHYYHYNSFNMATVCLFFFSNFILCCSYPLHFDRFLYSIESNVMKFFSLPLQFSLVFDFFSKLNRNFVFLSCIFCIYHKVKRPHQSFCFVQCKRFYLGILVYKTIQWFNAIWYFLYNEFPNKNIWLAG